MHWLPLRAGTCAATWVQEKPSLRRRVWAVNLPPAWPLTSDEGCLPPALMTQLVMAMHLLAA